MIEYLRLGIWESYMACWTDPDLWDRKMVLSHLLDASCSFTDHNIEISGIDDLSDYMGQFQKNHPGAKFVTTNFNDHHDHSLLHWKMVNSEGMILRKGANFGIFKDGRLSKIIGFFFSI
jgi:hypothetical protein